jgi:hypothetical protein
VSIHYERNNALRRVVITVLEGAGREEIQAVVEQECSGAVEYGILYDFRRACGTIPMETLISLHSSHVARGRRPSQGPVAVVTTNLKSYSQACKHVALAQAEGQIEVFHDREEAEAWLTDAT